MTWKMIVGGCLLGERDKRHARTRRLPCALFSGWLLLVGASHCVCVGIECWPKPSSGERNDSFSFTETTRRSPQTLSLSSCAGCHGSHDVTLNQNSDQRWKSAYQIWVSCDPHAGAYHALRNKRSRLIVAALASGSSVERSAVRQTNVSENEYQQILNQRCVACHSSVPPAMSVEMAQRSIGSDASDHPKSATLLMGTGVNCHSCHSVDPLDQPDGNPWIEAHTKVGWHEPTVDQVAMGLQNLADLSWRARTCVRCHVGTAAGDVNHDLIAAGHPRLEFEFASYLARLPKHWQEPELADFTSRCWSAGKLETARATLNLLNHRATLATQQSGPWPEFAEYDCGSCHHSLAGQRMALTDVSQPRSWLIWSQPQLTGLANPDLSRLRNEMQRPYPDPATILQLADARIEAEPPWQPVEHLLVCLESSPPLWRTDLSDWYGAVQVCLTELLPKNSPARSMLKERLEKFRSSVTKNSEVRSSDSESAAEIKQQIMEIQQILVPLLKDQLAAERNATRQTQ